MVTISSGPEIAIQISHSYASGHGFAIGHGYAISDRLQHWSPLAILVTACNIYALGVYGHRNLPPPRMNMRHTNRSPYPIYYGAYLILGPPLASLVNLYERSE